MEDQFRKLTEQLLSVNQELSTGQARTWVESLWEDFEATRAKGGWSYKGPEVTAQIVSKWINQYGPHLHRYQPRDKKFAHLNKEDELKQ
ncbi:YfhJ family protein [Halalkalibacter oceani]|uniref:YfhJ family protein n=1 Tax=Halalkalibacter oceani TaxID=1653776 RepID=A0A9X2IQ87_9BACI|nr:YfhJ family protein [Halalkalibacter oceani]